MIKTVVIVLIFNQSKELCMRNTRKISQNNNPFFDILALPGYLNTTVNAKHTISIFSTEQSSVSLSSLSLFWPWA